MDYNDIIQEFHEKNVIKGHISTRLTDILPRLTKNKLYYIARNYDIPRRSLMNKDELVRVIIDYIAYVGHLEDFLLIVRREELELFNRLSETDSMKINLLEPWGHEYLIEMGLIFLFDTGGSLYLSMPDEVKNLYRKLDKGEFMKRYNRYSHIADYMVATSNLYGTLPIDEFIKIFNGQNGAKLDVDELSIVYSALNSRQQPFGIVEGHIVSEYFIYDDVYEEFQAHLEGKAGKHYYVPQREELLRYADLGYLEWTPQLRALQDFILKEMCSDSELVEGLVEDIQLSCSMDASLQDLFNQFERRKIYIQDDRQLNVLVQHLVETKNNTRLWVNCGHTPSELAQINDELSNTQQSQQRRVERIGRNAPCPCGSGKKYKRCCGR